MGKTAENKRVFGKYNNQTVNILIDEKIPVIYLEFLDRYFFERKGRPPSRFIAFGTPSFFGLDPVFTYFYSY